MSNIKFNPKIYLGKDRIYKSVPKANNISKLYYWDADKLEYCFSELGKTYLAKRYELDENLRKKKVSKYFDTLEEARTWQTNRLEDVSSTPSGLTFGELVNEWKKRLYSTYSEGTVNSYDQVLRLHLCSLFNTPVNEITTKRVDDWIDQLKDSVCSSSKKHLRISFKKELSCLRVILRYYLEYYPDSEYRMPILERHNKIVLVKKNVPIKMKDLTEEEFGLFRTQIGR